MRPRELQLEPDGAELIAGLIPQPLVKRARESAPDARAGRRNAIERWPDGREIARAVVAFVGARSEGVRVLTRTILFDKSPDANWHLRMHRDVTVAVARVAEVVGYGPWSTKNGVVHVRPPLSLLERMLTVRVHLDPADESNGCLRVHPGTHRDRRYDPGTADLAPSSGVALRGLAGDAVLMRPLLLHGSERSVTNAPRRVLHLELALDDPDPPIRWEPVETGELASARC